MTRWERSRKWEMWVNAMASVVRTKIKQHFMRNHYFVHLDWIRFAQLIDGVLGQRRKQHSLRDHTGLLKNVSVRVFLFTLDHNTCVYKWT